MNDKKPLASASAGKTAGKKPRRRIRIHLRKKKHDTETMARFSESRAYYERNADRFHLLRTLSALLLAAVIILSGFMSYGFLVDNQFRYLYKAWKINPVSLGKQYHDISYAAGNGASFTMYKNDLAVIESDKITVYDVSGDRRFRAEAPNVSAKQAFAVSGKYVALYTPGDKRFAIYDSFSSVYEHTFAYPIRLAAVSDSGKFAVCLREEERIVIEVYDSNAAKAMTVKLDKNTVVYDLDLSPNGDKLAITTIEGGDAFGAGNYYTDFSLWDVSSEKKIVSERIMGKRPIATSFLDNMRMYFACEGSVMFFQTGGKKIRTVTAPAQYMIASDGKTVAVSDGTSLVSVYSAKGEEKAEFALTEKILGLKTGSGCCYTFSNKSVSVYDGDGEKKGTYEIRSGALDFFPLSDGSILVCYVSETKRIVP